MNIYVKALISFAALVPLAAVVFGLIKAPYGRFARSGWGPAISSRIAWFLIWLPSVFVFLWFFIKGARVLDNTERLVPIILMTIWQVNAIHRTFIYPLRIRPSGSMPLLLVSCGFCINMVAGYLNGAWITTRGPGYHIDWLSDPRFIIGVIVFIIGFLVNRWSDHTLRVLRRPGETAYWMPLEGLFRFVSCPNYLGEIIMWSGWALLSWSLPGLILALFATANLLPRALNNHKWYKSSFNNYPSERKALIPFIL